MTASWKRCGHPRTPENTSGTQCRTCRRLRETRNQERARADAPKRAYEPCGAGFVRSFTLDEDGFTREDRAERRDLIAGSKRLAEALHRAMAA